MSTPLTDFNVISGNLRIRRQSTHNRKHTPIQLVLVDNLHFGHNFAPNNHFALNNNWSKLMLREIEPKTARHLLRTPLCKIG